MSVHPQMKAGTAYGWSCCVSVPLVHLLHDSVPQYGNREYAPIDAYFPHVPQYGNREYTPVDVYSLHEIHWLLCCHKFLDPFTHDSSASEVWISSPG
jgi:hypothetical protein